jgi:hypothetical protein
VTVVIAYILAPFPNLMCANCGKGYEEAQERYEDQISYIKISLIFFSLCTFSAFIDAGNFFTGMIIVSGLGACLRVSVDSDSF